MATAAQVRSSVKNRLGIKSADTTWDTLIDEFVSAAVLRLYPRAALELSRQTYTDFTVDSYGETEIPLTDFDGPFLAARQVESWDGFTWQRVTDTYHHGIYLRLRGLSSSVTKLRLYGITSFPTIDDVYDYFLQSIYWYAQAEFYDYLAGSQSDYNIYQQATGARAVDNMRDESVYFDTKADNYIEQQLQSYGL